MFKSRGNKCGGRSDYFVEAVKPSRESSMNGWPVVYKPQLKSRTTRGFQCLVRGNTDFSHGSADKWFIEISVERASKSILSPLL